MCRLVLRQIIHSMAWLNILATSEQLASSEEGMKPWPGIALEIVLSAFFFLTEVL